MSGTTPEGTDVPNWWLEPGFIAFDTETTGIDSAVARIVTAAAVHFLQGRPVDTRTWLLAIDIPIPPESTAVHGITDEASRGQGIAQAEALLEIRDYLAAPGLPVVAFNSAFDVAMLDANLARQGHGPLAGVDVICPYVLDKQCNKYVRGSGQRKLQPTAARYGITLSDEAWHSADGDAVVAGEIFVAEMAAYASLRAMAPSALAEATDTWREQQDADFKAWLASKQH